MVKNPLEERERTRVRTERVMNKMKKKKNWAHILTNYFFFTNGFSVSKMIMKLIISLIEHYQRKIRR